MEPLKISNSELTTFRDCRRRWYLEYYRRYKTPEKDTGPLALGSAVHASLAAYYTPGGSKGMSLGVLSAIYEEARSKLGISDPVLEKEAKLARIMVEGYFDWVEEEGVDADLEIIEAEAEIEHNTEVSGRPIRLVGKRDAIGRLRNTGTATLIDHKTCQSLTDPALDLNEQSRMYLLLQRLNGSTVLQNCTWNLLRKVQRTATAKPPFYAREDIYVSEQELRYFWERIHGIIRDILGVRQALDSGESHRSICYPRPSRDCGWKCQFRVVCPMIDADPHFEEFLSATYSVGDPYSRYEAKGE
jgi:hypothetical protein